MHKNKGKALFAAVMWLTFFATIGLCDLVLAQEKTDADVCPKPYIKLIKPRLAQEGQQITIRGRRFGDAESSGEVVFAPGIGGNVVSWANNRITVEVPSGAKTGDVVVTNKCGRSDRSMITIGTKPAGEKK